MIDHNPEVPAFSCLQAVRPMHGFASSARQTTSDYLIDGINKWRTSWERRNWQTAHGKLVALADVWQALFAEVDARQVPPTSRTIEQNERAKFWLRVMNELQNRGVEDILLASPMGRKYPAIAQSWHRVWQEVIPFFSFPGEVRWIVFTMNATEALNSNLLRVIRARGHFPSDEVAAKLLFLILSRSKKEWVMPPRAWAMAKAQFAVIFGERFVLAMAV